jgi:hypothetical protein
VEGVCWRWGTCRKLASVKSGIYLNILGLLEFALDLPVSFFGSGEWWRFRVCRVVFLMHLKT